MEHLNPRARSAATAAAFAVVLFTAAATARPVGPAPTPAVDIAALIECRAGVADYAAVVGRFDDPAQAPALGLEPLPRSNRFMAEFALAQPLTVFGQPSRHIAVAGGSIMAVLDVADPRPLASQLALETGYDAPDKFMAGREVVSRDITTPGTGETMIESVILSVSTVLTHPGRTLAGCTYSLDEPELPPVGTRPAEDAAAR